MRHPLPELLETFPGFRDAYDNYCLAPWSFYRGIERDLLPRMMNAYSESGMSSKFKTGVQALIDCMKFATVAAERADKENSIDLVTQTGHLKEGNIFAYGWFKLAFEHSWRVPHSIEGKQRAQPGFRVEWPRYVQGQSTVAQLLRSILSELNMRTVAPGRREPIEQATNGAWKRDWLAHVCSSNSATHRACSTIRKHDGDEALFRQLVLSSINVQNYETLLETCPSFHCLFPSDDLICSIIGHAKCAIYTHPDLVNSYYGPEMPAPASRHPHTPHSLASPLVLKSQIDRRRHRRREGQAGRC